MCWLTAHVKGWTRPYSGYYAAYVPTGSSSGD
jgi:hypothetical protein